MQYMSTSNNKTYKLYIVLILVDQSSVVPFVLVWKMYHFEHCVRSEITDWTD